MTCPWAVSIASAQANIQVGSDLAHAELLAPGGPRRDAPILLAAVAFGLATGYGVFLLSRIKEARDRGATDSEAVAIGLERTGRIVTAAAVRFAVAIGAFATSKLVLIKELGVGTALAVLIDASIIRALLVPSLMELLGSWNWWAPKPLRSSTTASVYENGSPRRELPSRRAPNPPKEAKQRSDELRTQVDRRALDPLRRGGEARPQSLGITAFGCQVFALPPNVGGPRHSESGTGQQELYVNLGGSGWIDVDHRVEFGPHTMIPITPESVRQPASGAQGLTYLCVGAPPEAPYQPIDKFI